MNWERLRGSWKQVKGHARQQWGKLTDDDLEAIAGEREKLTGRLQERYGYAKDRAEQEVDSWVTTVQASPER